MIIKDYDPKDIDMKMLYEDTSWGAIELNYNCLLYTSPSPRDAS